MDKLEVAIRALREIRDHQGRVCSNFELCKHVSCTSSYISWSIAEKALRNIEDLAKYNCVTYRCLEETGLYRAYRKEIQAWLDDGKGVAIYSTKPADSVRSITPKKYCSFGTPESMIPDCEIPPKVLPKLHPYAGKVKGVSYLIGFIHKRRNVDEVCG